MENNIEIQQKKRYLFIDYAKCFAIYLVVLAHLNLKNIYVDTFINSFHMQIFFFLSGVCYSFKGIKVDFKNNVQKLLIPYVSFYVLSYPYWLLKNFLFNHKNFSFNNYLLKPFLGLLFGNVADTSCSSMVIGAVWFLLALFLIKTIFSFMYNLPLYIKIIVNFAIVVIALLLVNYNIFMPLSLRPCMFCLPFFELGFALKKNIMNIIKIDFKVRLLVIILLFLSICSLSKLNGFFHVSDGVYGNNIFLFYINGILGSFLLIFLASLFENHKLKLLSYFGQNTLIIMIFEVYAFAPIKLITRKILNVSATNQNYMSLPLAILAAIISMFICLLPIWFINKYLPFCIGKKKTRSNEK